MRCVSGFESRLQYSFDRHVLRCNYAPARETRTRSASAPSILENTEPSTTGVCVPMSIRNHTQSEPHLVADVIEHEPFSPELAFNCRSSCPAVMSGPEGPTGRTKTEAAFRTKEESKREQQESYEAAERAWTVKEEADRQREKEEAEAAHRAKREAKRRQKDADARADRLRQFVEEATRQQKDSVEAAERARQLKEEADRQREREEAGLALHIQSDQPAKRFSKEIQFGAIEEESPKEQFRKLVLPGVFGNNCGNARELETPHEQKRVVLAHSRSQDIMFPSVQSSRSTGSRSHGLMSVHFQSSRSENSACGPGFKNSQIKAALTSRRNGIMTPNAKSMYRQLKYIHPAAPIRVVPFSDLCSHGELPRSNNGLAVHPRSICEDPIIIFISHRWLRPWHTEEECKANGHVWAGAAHPDDANRTKFNLIVDGVKQLAFQIDAEFWQLGIWLDYACIDQDVHELKIAGIQSLLGYVSKSFCMLVPTPEAPKFKTVHHCPEYGQRAWTRLEAFAFYVENLLGKGMPNIFYSTVGQKIEHMDYELLPYLYPNTGDIFDQSDLPYIMEQEQLLLNVVHEGALFGTIAAYAPAMVAAAGAGDSTRVTDLLEMNIPVDAADRNGVTGLWSAARMGHADMVNKLIGARANLDAKAASGYAPLHCAARGGHVEVWHALVHHKADLSLEYKPGMRPIELAKQYGHVAAFGLDHRDSVGSVVRRIAAVLNCCSAQ